MPPVNVFAPARVSSPEPAFVSVFPRLKSEITPLTVSAAPLFTVQV